MPVATRAVLVGLACSLAGTLPFNLLGGANLLFGASVPWSVPLVAGYLWIYSHARGAAERVTGLETALDDPWFWILGCLALVSGAAMVWAFARLAALKRAERTSAALA